MAKAENSFYIHPPAKAGGHGKSQDALHPRQLFHAPCFSWGYTSAEVFGFSHIHNYLMVPLSGPRRL